MNCQECQAAMLNVLAAAGENLPPEAALHCQACSSCRESYRKQVTLFGAIDLGIQSLVNQEIPGSLMRRVQVRLSSDTPKALFWTPSSGTALFASATVLSVCLTLFLYGRGNLENAERPDVSVSIVTTSKTPAPPLEKTATAAVLSRKSTHARALQIRTGTAEPEVIVLAEEREAFTKFVNALPRETNVAVALTRPAPASTDGPVEFALLRISELEVKPLEGMPSD
jgi:hypothetical protein